MHLDLSDFKKPQWWLSFIVAFILGGAFVAAFIYYTFSYRLPALETREDKQDKTLDTAFALVRSDITALNLGMQGLRINVAALCELRRSKVCDFQSLITEVKRTSQIQAEYFTAADVRLTPGSAQPIVVSHGLGDRLPRFEKYEYLAAKRDKPAIANAILWSTAAESAQWHQEGNRVVAVFANGTASFDLSAPSTKERVGDLVQSLNETTEALKAAGSTTPEKK